MEKELIDELCDNVKAMLYKPLFMLHEDVVGWDIYSYLLSTTTPVYKLADKYSGMINNLEINTDGPSKIELCLKFPKGDKSKGCDMSKECIYLLCKFAPFDLYMTPNVLNKTINPKRVKPFVIYNCRMFTYWQEFHVRRMRIGFHHTTFKVEEFNPSVKLDVMKFNYNLHQLQK